MQDSIVCYKIIKKIKSNFEAIDNIKNFVQKYSLTLFSKITKAELKNAYDTVEYEKFVLGFIYFKYLKKLKKWLLKKMMEKLLEYVDIQNGIQKNTYLEKNFFIF